MKEKTTGDSECLCPDKIFSKIGKMVKIIDDIRIAGSIPFDFFISFPRIVVIGEPSCGKSSLIDTILGYDFLPRNIKTKRPIEIKLVHVPMNNNQRVKPICEFTSTNEKFEDFAKAKAKLSEMLSNCGEKDLHLMKDPIRITISSNQSADLTIIDTLGIDDASTNVSKLARDIASNFMQDESSLILQVISFASLSDENSNSSRDSLFNFIQKSDPEGKRTICVITKCDLSPPSGNFIKKYLDTTSNTNSNTNTNTNTSSDIFKLKYGYVCVKPNLTPNSNYYDIIHKEREFFSSHNAFRFLAINDYFTIETLSEKIKKYYYECPYVKKAIAQAYTELKNSISKCQDELAKFGTDYIAYTNQSKNTYLQSLINILCESIYRMFSGKAEKDDDNFPNRDLRLTYYGLLKKYIDYTPGTAIKNEDVIKILIQVEGIDLTGFPGSEVIYALLENELDLLRDEVRVFLDTVGSIVTTAVRKLIERLFCRFPKVLEKIEELVNAFLDKNFETLKYLVTSIAEMNFNYLYIDERSISYKDSLQKNVLQDDGNKDSRRDSKESRDKGAPLIERTISSKDKGKDNYYNGLAEYVKTLVNYIYSLIVRNLREYLPKSTGNFYVRNLKDNLRFYLLTEISKDYSFYEYLEEDPEVAKKRNYFIDLMKMLKVAEKTFLYDNDIMLAIKGDSRKSIDRIFLANFNPDSASTMEVRPNLRVSRDSFKEKEKENIQVVENKRVSSATITSSYANSNNNNQQNPKYSIQTLLRDDDQKKTVGTPQNSQTSQSTTQRMTTPPTRDNKEGTISLKFDPNTNDIKDAKINLNMDAETAYKIYQNNKQYLPSAQQVLSGAKATANFFEKVYDETVDSKENENSSQDAVVTGGKSQPRKKNDPLTSLFGTTVTKKENSSGGSGATNSTTAGKKGFF